MKKPNFQVEKLLTLFGKSSKLFISIRNERHNYSEGEGEVINAVKYKQWSVVAERSSALDSSFGVVGSNPGLAGHGACVLEQDT